MRFGHAEERREDGKGGKEKAFQSLTYQKVAVHLVRDLVVAEHGDVLDDGAVLADDLGGVLSRHAGQRADHFGKGTIGGRTRELTGSLHDLSGKKLRSISLPAVQL